MLFDEESLSKLLNRSLLSHSAVNMPETAESHAVALTTNRNCVMEITNVSSVYCLVNPK